MSKQEQFDNDPPPAPRMLSWLVLTGLLVGAAMLTQEAFPGSVLAVTLYKSHLMALGGWGGYWLDRALFPYDRPHQYLLPDPPEFTAGNVGTEFPATEQLQAVAGTAFALAMLRRAITVAACLVCVGLGA